MNKLVLFLSLVFFLASADAQEFQISFAGTGASNSIDSVNIQNLTQSTSASIGGNDILHLAPNVGIDELGGASGHSLTIYPNPMTGNCSIEFETPDQGDANFRLIDISGNLILQQQKSLLKGHHTFSLSNIGSGFYFLNIKSDSYFYTAKIISHSSAAGWPEIVWTRTTLTQSKNVKNGQSLIDLQYNAGDLLKFTGKSGDYLTVVMLVASQDQVVTFNFVGCSDADGHNYPVVQIGTQLWMAENLKTTRYQNGDTIPKVIDATAWENQGTGAYCNYLNSLTYAGTFGKLYNWFTISDVRNIAPAGWHVPSNTEFTVLTTYLGGASVAGGKLKESGTTHWISPNPGATNETGFTALPGGFRASNGTYYYLGSTGMCWTNSEYIQGVPYNLSIGYDSSLVLMNTGSPENGLQIRCIKD